MKDWELAEAKIRRHDFDGAARVLRGQGLGIEPLLRNTPSHDLLYSTPAAGNRISPAEWGSWRRQAKKRKSAALWALVGAAELAAGKGKPAQKTLSQALALEPDLAPARLLRAAAVLHHACMDPDNSGRLDCVADLNRVIAASPEEVRALRLRAEAHNDLENYEQAIADLQRALQLDPANGWARVELADLFCDLGRFDQAWPLIKSLERAGRSQGWYWALRGRALATSGKAKPGLKALGKAVRLSPRLASALAWQGEAYRALGRYGEALKAFNKAIKLDPAFAYAYEWRARLLLMLSRPSEALQDVRTVVKMNPRHQFGPALLCETLFKLSRYRQAARAFDSVKFLDPRKTWNPPVKEGRLTSPQEREEAFWADIDSALKRSPKNAALSALISRFKSPANSPDSTPMLDVFLNYACQAKCPFCYNPPLTLELKRWKLPMERLAGELLAGYKKGFRGATFSGGEVTLLPELPKILRLARKAGFSRLGLISNGIRLADAAYAKELRDCGMSFCCLSVHAAEAALHDGIVAVPGAFEKILRALEHLRGLSVPVVLNFVLTRKNIQAAPDFIERFAGLPGIVEFQLYFPHYEGLMNVHAEELKLSVAQALPFLKEAFSRARRLGAEKKVFLYNMPPCALPFPPERLRNWEKEPSSLLIDPKGVEDGKFLEERRDRYKNALCARCALNARCLGFEQGYVKRYGDAEIRPLAAHEAAS